MVAPQAGTAAGGSTSTGPKALRSSGTVSAMRHSPRRRGVDHERDQQLRHPRLSVSIYVSVTVTLHTTSTLP